MSPGLRSLQNQKVGDAAIVPVPQLAQQSRRPAAADDGGDGGVAVGWEYDEYHLELADTGSLSEDVLANFDTLLAQAKAAETPAEQGDLESRVTTLEETSASKDDVQAVWDRMAAAYNEGVNEA